jgi:LacI family transcriptional regulator
MTTIRDVAKMAGVSTSTVSHVINQTRFVSQETQARVREAMRQLNYTPNNIAQSLRRQRTNTIGVLLPTTANPYFGGILAAIEAASFERGHNLIIGNANDNPEREQAYLQVLISQQIAGMLLISTGDIPQSVARLRDQKVPVVVVDRPTGDTSVDEVWTDNRQGGYLATRHLLDHGHEQIACITGPDNLINSRQRYQGYVDALQKAGQPIDNARIGAGLFDPVSGYEATRELLAARPDTTAIFACNDLMAIGAIRAIYEADGAVPDDVSVVGFDNISMSAYTTPQLSTVDQPIQDVGRIAVKRLLDRVENPDAPHTQDVLPVQLIARWTSGPVSV